MAATRTRTMKSLSSFSVLLIVGLIAQNTAFVPSKQRSHTTTPWCRSVSVRRSTLTTESAVSQLTTVTTELPVEVDVLSQDPLVYVIPDLLSPEECQSYQSYVNGLKAQNRFMTRSNPPEVSLNYQKLWPLPFLSLLAGVPKLLFKMEEGAISSWSEILSIVLEPSLIALGTMIGLALSTLPLIRFLSNKSSRTSDAIALNWDEDTAFIQGLVNRVQAYTGHPWDYWEAPVVTRYAPGAVFSKHGDASPTKGSEWDNMGGQRVVTCICYLNDVDHGGETYFDKLGFGVTPKQGCAVIFYPADLKSWNADDRTTHESLPPVTEKWIVQMFGRRRRVPPPLGLPDSFSSLSVPLESF